MFFHISLWISPVLDAHLVFEIVLEGFAIGIDNDYE